MRQNIFKNEGEGYDRRQKHDNAFKRSFSIENTAYVNDAKNDDVVTIQEPDQEQQEPTIKYSMVAKKEVTIVDPTAKDLMPGWIKMSKGPDGKINVEYDSKSNKHTRVEPSLHDQMNSAIQCMKNNWLQYREKYIDLYGEEDYKKYYGNDYNYDYDSEEEYHID